MTTQIDQEELDKLRTEQEKYMPDSGSLSRKTYLGGGNDVAGDHIVVVSAARVTPGWGTWRLMRDKFQGIVAYTITFPWDQDVRDGDIFLDTAGRKYRIRAVKDHSSYDTACQTLAELIGDGSA